MCRATSMRSIARVLDAQGDLPRGARARADPSGSWLPTTIVGVESCPASARPARATRRFPGPVEAVRMELMLQSAREAPAGGSSEALRHRVTASGEHVACRSRWVPTPSACNRLRRRATARAHRSTARPHATAMPSARTRPGRQQAGRSGLCTSERSPDRVQLSNRSDSPVFTKTCATSRLPPERPFRHLESTHRLAGQLGTRRYG